MGQIFRGPIIGASHLTAHMLDRPQQATLAVRGRNGAARPLRAAFEEALHQIEDRGRLLSAHGPWRCFIKWHHHLRSNPKSRCQEIYVNHSEARRSSRTSAVVILRGSARRWLPVLRQDGDEPPMA